MFRLQSGKDNQVEPSISNSIAVTEALDKIALVKLDMPGTSANVLTVELFAELESTFRELQARTDLSGLVLYSAKPSIFVAGADLKRIVSTLDWPDEEIIKFCEDGRAIMSRLSQMPFMTVAAIHGACVGGGLEIALWCDRRIATSDRKTIFGLPEVKLGLVPGWAGTVRLPRISQLERAIDLVTSGRVVKADEALQFGMVDQVVQPDALVDSALQMIREEQFENAESIRRTIGGAVSKLDNLEAIRTKYADKIASSKTIYPFACEIALEHMLDSAGKSHDEACHGESLAMAKVYGSEPSHGLLNNFFLGEHNKKQPGFVDVKLSQRPITTVGIVGAGLMGASIASICLNSGCNVVLFDADADAVQKAMQLLLPIAEKARGAPQCLAADEYSGLANCDLVIESVVEVADVKTSVLQRISQAVTEQTIIATNTSAIPLAKLSEAVTHPDRFCGLHFCHPDLMQLVEVVNAEKSSPEFISDVTNWIRGLRKMPVVVLDCPGFVVNRLLAAMLDQAIRLFAQGNSIVQIDEAMREFGFLGGPFEIVDVIGTDTCMYAGREMFEGGIKCVTVSPVLPRLVKKGWLGRKTGQGFYCYDTLDAEPLWNAEVDELLSSYVQADETRQSFSNERIAESICSCIVLEATRILEEGVVNSHKDIDLCVINGFSFPAHVGGVLFWSDRKTIGFVNGILENLAQTDSKLQPTNWLKSMQTQEKTFYDQ